MKTNRRAWRSLFARLNSGTDRNAQSLRLVQEKLFPVLKEMLTRRGDMDADKVRRYLSL